MELHHANARLKDEQVEVVVGSQALDKVQRAVAHALNYINIKRNTHILGSINIEALSNTKLRLSTVKKDCNSYDSIISQFIHIWDLN